MVRFYIDQFDRWPMLLTISTTHQPATDLGYLLHKHPDRAQALNCPLGRRTSSIQKPRLSDARPRCSST